MNGRNPVVFMGHVVVLVLLPSLAGCLGESWDDEFVMEGFDSERPPLDRLNRSTYTPPSRGEPPSIVRDWSTPVRTRLVDTYPLALHSLETTWDENEHVLDWSFALSHVWREDQANGRELRVSEIYVWISFFTETPSQDNWVYQVQSWLDNPQSLQINATHQYHNQIPWPDTQHLEQPIQWIRVDMNIRWRSDSSADRMQYTNACLGVSDTHVVKYRADVAHCATWPSIESNHHLTIGGEPWAPPEQWNVWASIPQDQQGMPDGLRPLHAFVAESWTGNFASREEIPYGIDRATFPSGAPGQKMKPLESRRVGPACSERNPNWDQWEEPAAARTITATLDASVDYVMLQSAITISPRGKGQLWIEPAFPSRQPLFFAPAATLSNGTTAFVVLSGSAINATWGQTSFGADHFFFDGNHTMIPPSLRGGNLVPPDVLQEAWKDAWRVVGDDRVSDWVDWMRFDQPIQLSGFSVGMAIVGNATYALDSTQPVIVEEAWMRRGSLLNIDHASVAMQGFQGILNISTGAMVVQGDAIQGPTLTWGSSAEFDWQDGTMSSADMQMHQINANGRYVLPAKVELKPVCLRIDMQRNETFFLAVKYREASGVGAAILDYAVVEISRGSANVTVNLPIPGRRDVASELLANFEGAPGGTAMAAFFLGMAWPVMLLSLFDSGNLYPAWYNPAGEGLFYVRIEAGQEIGSQAAEIQIHGQNHETAIVTFDVDVTEAKD